MHRKKCDLRRKKRSKLYVCLPYAVCKRAKKDLEVCSVFQSKRKSRDCILISNNLELDCCTAIQMSRQHSTIVST